MAEDSDEDMFTVPDVEASASQSVHSGGTNPNSNINQSNVNDPQLQSGKRRRGRNPADKEYRRLKRYMHYIYINYYQKFGPVIIGLGSHQ